MLIDNKTVCTETLSKFFDTNLRNIQRDMVYIKDFFSLSLYQTEKGCYKLQSESVLSNYITTKQKQNSLKDFFEFIALFDEKLLVFFDTDIFPMIKNIKKDVKQLYHILEKPIEKLDTRFVQDIKKSLIYRQYADVQLFDINSKTFKHVKPIKIIFAEGNWYLATITKDTKNNGFKFLRINFITDFKVHSNTFQRDLEAEEFIKNFQSLFQNYKEPKYEVKLLVDKEVARYFKVKKHLKSQKLIEITDNKDLILSFEINNSMEIAPLIKKWIPHIKVISPKSLDEFIKNDIKKFLNDI